LELEELQDCMTWDQLQEHLSEHPGYRLPTIKEAGTLKVDTHYFWTSKELGEDYAVIYNTHTEMPTHEANKSLPIPVVLIRIEDKSNDT